MGSSLRENLDGQMHTTASRDELQQMEIPADASQVVLVPNTDAREIAVYFFGSSKINVSGLGLARTRPLPLTIGDIANEFLYGRTTCLLIERHYDDCGADGQRINVYAG